MGLDLQDNYTLIAERTLSLTAMGMCNLFITASLKEGA